MGARADSRLAALLRRMAAEPACLARADGSARFSHGATEVLVAVYGPCEPKRSRERPDAAALECIVRPLGGLPGPVEREAEQLLCQTLSHLVLTAQHPRTAISVVVQILSDDGSLLSAALHGMCLALAHAGIPMRGMLGSCTLAVTSDEAVLLDPCVDEERDAQAVVTLAYQVRQRADGSSEQQLLLSHMRGALSAESQYDSMQHVAAEAAACATSFMRTTLTRQVQKLHEQPERGARASRVADLIADVKSRVTAATDAGE
jgi:exosome complex component RRP46